MNYLPSTVLNIFYSFIIISTRWRVCLFIWTNLNHHHLSMPCANLVEIDPVDLKKMNFKVFDIIFLVATCIISPWKRVWPFIWSSLNPLYPRMLCGSWEEDENVKSLHTDRQSDRRRTKVSLELSAKTANLRPLISRKLQIFLKSITKQKLFKIKYKVWTICSFHFDPEWPL